MAGSTNCVWITVWLSVGYTVDDIGAINGGSSFSRAISNSFGRDEVVGRSGTSNGQQAVVWDRPVNKQPEALLDLGTLLANPAPWTDAFGMNDSVPTSIVGFHGQGELSLGGNQYDGEQATPVLWEVGGNVTVATELPTLDGGTGQAMAVNVDNVIVGYSTNAAGDEIATRWNRVGQEWQIEALPTLGIPTSRATAINFAGTAVGKANFNEYNSHACRWIPGQGIQDLDGTAGSSAALAVNNFDQIVGWAYDGQTNAYIWDAATGMQILPRLSGAEDQLAYGLNDRGLIVGKAAVPGANTWESLAVIWWGQRGVASLTDQIYNNPGWSLVEATGINQRDQITGWGRSPSGDIRGWVLTPVRVPIQALFCPSTSPGAAFVPPQKFPNGYPLHIKAPNSIDGGGLYVDSEGRISHYPAPRADANLMVTEPSESTTVVEIVARGLARNHQPGLSRELKELAATILDREIQRLTSD
jgi:hypothetical protein